MQLQVSNWIEMRRSKVQPGVGLALARLCQHTTNGDDDVHRINANRKGTAIKGRQARHAPDTTVALYLLAINILFQIGFQEIYMEMQQCFDDVNQANILHWHDILIFNVLKQWYHQFQIKSTHGYPLAAWPSAMMDSSALLWFDWQTPIWWR